MASVQRPTALPEERRSTSTQQGLKSGADWLACAEPSEVDAFFEGLGRNAMLSLPWIFEFWALKHQLPPEGDWKSWVIMGGRGAGKTRAGAEWVRSLVEGTTPEAPGRCRRVALVAETLDQVRDVMVHGDSGIIACSPPDRKPKWIATKNRLEWPNGAWATAYSASSPEALRGPQFDAAWADELAKWRKGQETWDMLQFALRLGDHPQQVITTTPRNVGVLKDILRMPTTVSTHAPTQANKAWLAASFLEQVEARYGGTSLGRQEIEGEIVDSVEGALWTRPMLEGGRVRAVPEFGRIVVAVDPPTTSHGGSDACGIVVVGAVMDGPPQNWRAVVLEDASVRAASPDQWARAALAAVDRHKADRLVAEVNQGGEMVATIIRGIDPNVPFRAVSATRGKVVRAEPIAALYEQGRVGHVAGLAALEDQMCQMARSGYAGTGSPDRVDALVWALTDLMIDGAKGWQRPTVRTLG